MIFYLQCPLKNDLMNEDNIFFMKNLLLFNHIFKDTIIYLDFISCNFHTQMNYI